MRRLTALTSLIATTALAAGLGAVPAPAGALTEPEYRELHFPVEGAVRFSDDFGDPRSGGRSHAGNDLMGSKMQKLLAAADGTITIARLDASNLSGHMLTLKDAEGWQYRYLHLNNDTPGTDDGLALVSDVFAPGIATGAKVKAGQHVASLGDSGNAEGTAPHLHFELVRPDGTTINPWTSLRLASGLPAGTRCGYGTNPKAKPSKAAGAGYYVLGDDGGIFTFGTAPFVGSVPGLQLGTPVSALRLAATRSGLGYHILGNDGGVFTFGDAAFHGSVPGLGLGVRVRALDLQPTATGRGYWVLGADGGVFSFGDAPFYGSVPGLGITSAKALRLIPTPTGKGYWVLGVDGGVFSFGDAVFHGSVPGLGIATKVVALAADPRGRGYWVLGDDGGVFSFGVPFHGSVPGAGLCTWPKGVQMAPTTTGHGYWVVGSDGAVFAFGDAVDHGDVPGLGLTGVRAIDLGVVVGK